MENNHDEARARALAAYDELMTGLTYDPDWTEIQTEECDIKIRTALASPAKPEAEYCMDRDEQDVMRSALRKSVKVIQPEAVAAKCPLCTDPNTVIMHRSVAEGAFPSIYGEAVAAPYIQNPISGKLEYKGSFYTSNSTVEAVAAQEPLLVLQGIKDEMHASINEAVRQIGVASTAAVNKAYDTFSSPCVAAQEAVAWAVLNEKMTVDYSRLFADRRTADHYMKNAHKSWKLYPLYTHPPAPAALQADLATVREAHEWFGNYNPYDLNPNWQPRHAVVIDDVLDRLTSNQEVKS